MALACAASALLADGESLHGKLELRWRAWAALVALLALLASDLPALRRRAAARCALHALVAFLGIAALYNFGFFRHRNDSSFVNVWEQFHYQLGSKYFPELGYDGLYVASVTAQRESRPELPVEEPIRDLRSNEFLALAHLEAHRREIVDRFRPERWRDFVADHEHYLAATRPGVIGGIRRDHGYNPPPSWTFVARLFDARLPASDVGLALLASLDALALAALFAAIFASYGARVGCLCLGILGLAYGWRYTYMGALLRLDWLAASGIGVCLLERRRPAAAGACFGYASAVRLFPAVLLLGPAWLAARAWWRGESTRWAVRLAAGFTASLLALLLAGCLTGRGAGAWGEFADNIRLHRATWVPNRVALDTLVLYGPYVAREARRAWRETGALPRGRDQIYALTQREIRERFAAQRPLRLALRAGVLVLLGLAVWRASPAQAAVLSIAGIYALTPIDSYYWVLLVLLPLAGARGASLAVLGLAAALYGLDLYKPGAVVRHLAMAAGIGAILGAALLPGALRSLRRGPPAPAQSR